MTATTRAPRRTTKKPTAFRRDVGAPSTIDDICCEIDGQPITKGERIVQAIRVGAYVETAAAAADIDKSTFYDWLKAGARAHAKRSEGRKLTAKEKRYATFATAVHRAEAESELNDVSDLDKLARGGVVVTVKTTTRKGDDVIAETVREETTAPNIAALTWRLERRHPDRWGRRQAIEVGAIGEAGVGKVQSPLGMFMAELDAMERRQHEALAGVGAVDEALPAQETVE